MCILIDLTEAFHTFDQNISIDKLHRDGIRGIPLDSFTSYLENRQQYW